ncbi:aldehyde dehydrogenase family protein [Brasilonema sp. CT11]|nr:aldehyde dehydrogenase family protein [Brasilonema sp. CT11]
MKNLFSNLAISDKMSSPSIAPFVLTSINPSTTEILGEVVISSEKEIHDMVEYARSAQKKWQLKTVFERISLIEPILKKFVESKKVLAQLITDEMGKPINEAQEEMEDGFECIQWYLDNVSEAIQPTINHEDRHEIHQTTYQPCGVTACIVPWNFPFLNFVWSVIPNLLVGNTVVFKHSEKCPLFSKQLDVLMDSMLPKGVFSVVYGDGIAGEQLIRLGVDQICFTGSSQTGLMIHQLANSQAAKLNKIVRVHTELGGSAPGIVFEDVDIESTAKLIYKARFENCGQVCDGLKRLVVQKSIYDALLEALIKILESKTIGNPSSIKTHIGPLVDSIQFRALKEQVEDAKINGASIITAGSIPLEMNGYFYLPTLITNVERNMRVWKEEVFGPVLPIVIFSEVEEAIELANDTIYGLGGYLYSNDKQLLRNVRSQMKTGMVSENGTYYVRPFVPFGSGGYGLSGTGINNGQQVFKKLCCTQVTSYPWRKHTFQSELTTALNTKLNSKKEIARQKLIQHGIWKTHDDGVVEIKSYELPLKIGSKNTIKKFNISLFVFGEGGADEDAYYVATYGDLNHLGEGVPLVRLQSLCPHGHYLHSAHCDCDEQRDLALEKISKDPLGGIFIMGAGENHAGRGIGQVMIAALYSYGYQTGRDVVASSFNDLSFKRDERNFESMMEILRRLKVRRIRLLTNNPDKVKDVTQSGGVEVVKVLDLIGKVSAESLKERILLARAGHTYDRVELEKLKRQIVEEGGVDPLDAW